MVTTFMDKVRFLVNFLNDRAKEPGTMRSVAVVLFALKGVTPDEATIQMTINGLILALGVLSAMLPETKVIDAPAVISTVVEKATVAGAIVDDVKETAEQANEALQGARDVAAEIPVVAAVAKGALNNITGKR